MTYVDLAYLLCNLYSYTQNQKLVSNNKRVKIYCLYVDSALSVTFVYDNTNFNFTIKSDTKIEDVVDECFILYSKLKIESVAFTKCDFESFVVDEVENIYYTLLSEDGVKIVVDENFFTTVPKNGDILDSNFNVDISKTNQRKIAIEEKFKNLLK